MSIASFVAADGQGGGALAQSLAPAVGTGLSTGVSALRGRAAGDGSFDRLGLAMRFAVTFTAGGISSRLGEWASCTGLDVQFKTEPIEVGGHYDGAVQLPLRVEYSPVVLKRAVGTTDSHRLQVWLNSLVAAWADGGEHALAKLAGTVEIELHDVHQERVATWVLREALPVSWQGPELGATSNAVATETLTLRHMGFLPPTAPVGQEEAAR
ncbi:phage tail protein [Kitasatospora viridis]|uniref:Phage tail-like protein n=1 Tax=Kitasatospora viridis TaxID=281105 RepID=A0A561TV45_9ACTN|nr:phage tail protein [Kitasatospora viridis]TWF90986.1 phage tail-like protein [Kitasatospora viridis]